MDELSGGGTCLKSGVHLKNCVHGNDGNDLKGVYVFDCCLATHSWHSVACGEVVRWSHLAQILMC